MEPCHDGFELPSEDPTEIREFLTSRGWGDGLPVVVPTKARVDAFFEHNDFDPDELVGILPPRQGEATNRVIAINAVMAGCPSELFPIVRAAIAALCRPEANLAGAQATTGPAASLIIVHGEAVERFGFNAGHGTFGPGWVANSSVGRAVRFVLSHAGGTRAGQASMTTQGQPGQFGICIAENLPATPWRSYPSSIGIDAPSALTVFISESLHNAQDHTSIEPRGVLRTIASMAAAHGSNATYACDAEVFVILCPEHAQLIASDGWSRRDVQLYLYEHARLSRLQLTEGGCAGMDSWRPWMHADSELDQRLPCVDHPDDFRILVAGGAGKHTAVLTSWGPTRSVTLPLNV
ncbi:MAG: hypothetical protein GY910_05605 [bacterium]|nr:hypothetical protein [Deltaproteobacteria bacterium]MCP4904436.1 hypothetical protein [bacterium]